MLLGGGGGAVITKLYVISSHFSWFFLTILTFFPQKVDGKFNDKQGSIVAAIFILPYLLLAS
jgi:hypothetical protein